MSLIPLKNYLRHRIVYYMLVLSLFTLFGTYLQVVFEDKKRTADLAQGLEDNELDIRAKYEYFMRTALFFILFACPSTKMFFAYLSNFILFIFILSAHKGNWDDDQFIEALAQQPAYIVTCFVCFHILQTRQLKRYFKQQHTITKEIQTRKVLDSQSDAIIAVENQEGDQSDLNFLFCNSKSLELLNFNVMDAQGLLNQVEAFSPMICNPVDIPRFKHLVFSDSLDKLHQ